MIIGIPREGEVSKGLEEKRVALSPAGVREVVDCGAQIVTASGAGLGAGFRDSEYVAAGARIVYSNEEVIRRADVTVLVGPPDPSEWGFYNRESALLSFIHLGIPKPRLIEMLLENNITAVAYELVREDDGARPIMRVSSEIAGRMAPQIAGHLLETTSGGRGILLGGIPGIPPADVTIIGGGTVGFFAARSFLGTGASVYLLDYDLKRLREIDKFFQGKVITALSNQANLEKHVAFADVVVASPHIPGQPPPIVISEQMVEKMSPGSVIIDFSIDQGGCVETSRLNPSGNFLFTCHGVIHFCAPNVPTIAARTSTHGLTNVLLPYLKQIARDGIDRALKEDPSLRRGLYTYNGKLSMELPLAGFPTEDLERILNAME